MDDQAELDVAAWRGGETRETQLTIKGDKWNASYIMPAANSNKMATMIANCLTVRFKTHPLMVFESEE